MNRFIPLLVVLVAAGVPALAQTYYLSPDVPTDDPAAAAITYLPWDIVRNVSGTYSLQLSLPANTAVDSLHAMCNGNWLFSVETHVELPPLGPVTHDPRDVVEYDPALGTYTPFFCGGPVGIPVGSDLDAAFLDGDDSADLIIGFDVLTDLTLLGGGIYDPADLVRFRRTGAGCAGWAFISQYFNGSGTTPPTPDSVNVTGADRHTRPLPFTPLRVLTFDIPALSTPTYFPGELVWWDATASSYGIYYSDPNWKIENRTDAISFLPGPGDVPSMHVTKSTLTTGDLTITWVPSTSAGAEDYGIYEGTIFSTWSYSHARVVCTDAGVPLTEDITPSSGDQYYLVVALNPFGAPPGVGFEGSYGTDSSSNERPQGSPACRPAQDFDCP